MRLAPAVTVTASNAGAWRLLQRSVLAASAGVGAAWGALQMTMTGDVALVAGVAASAATAVAGRWWPARPAVIRWTGQTWQQSRDPGGPFTELRSVEVAVDLGTALLLRLRPATTSAGWGLHGWAVVTRAEAGPDFRAFCVALYAPAANDAVSADGLRAG